MNVLRRTSRHRDDAGFTLIELLVVTLILAILAAAAIPMYVRQREGAFTAAIVSDLRNAGAAQAYLVLAGNAPAETTAELVVAGFSQSEGVLFTNDGDFTDHPSGLCIEATHEVLVGRTWIFSTDGDSNPREASC